MARVTQNKQEKLLLHQMKLTDAHKSTSTTENRNNNSYMTFPDVPVSHTFTIQQCGNTNASNLDKPLALTKAMISEYGGVSNLNKKTC